MLEYIIFLGFMIILPFPNIYSFNILLTRKEPQRRNFWLVYFIIFIEYSIISFGQLECVITSAVIKIIFFLILLFFYEGTVIKKILALLVTYVVMAAGNFLAFAVLIPLDMTPNDFSLYDSSSYMFYIVNYAFFFLLCYLVIRFRRGRIPVLNWRYWLLFLPFAVLVCYSAIAFAYFMLEYPADVRFWVIILLAGGLLLSILVFVYLLNSIEKNASLQQQNRLRLAVYENQEQQLELIENNRCEVSKLNHDMKNHLYIVNAYLRENRLAEATAYLNKYLGEYAAVAAGEEKQQ